MSNLAFVNTSLFWIFFLLTFSDSDWFFPSLTIPAWPRCVVLNLLVIFFSFSLENRETLWLENTSVFYVKRNLCQRVVSSIISTLSMLRWGPCFPSVFVILWTPNISHRRGGFHACFYGLGLSSNSAVVTRDVRVKILRCIIVFFYVSIWNHWVWAFLSSSNSFKSA